METHTVHGGLLRRSVRVLVVGCGGTGSAIVGGLPYLHQAMIASGHPGGVHRLTGDAALACGRFQSYIPRFWIHGWTTTASPAAVRQRR